MFAIVAALVWGVDQISKVLAVAYLEGSDSITVVPGVLWLSFLRNPGAAFGTGAQFTIVISMIAIIATVALLFMARRLRDRWWAVAFGFFLAGALGNLTDRIFRAPGALHGHVVDFLKLFDWFVFNIADLSLNIAAVMIVIRAFQGIGLDGTREQAKRPATDTEEGEV
ncbi:signal peptidase II [Aeromicrobium sp. PE09-221]|uniref:signal peptidase II n=1 Tax=Aeromicrobium sp. PE09-221 TaxID=1898043 RepID=UPI000B744EEC|nr:signal peptidase II [Aeromicrobium sp. PE09-221]OUZ09915.1 signal peptidase II [Aeromicrobium sp. PE09-221]